MTTIPRATYTSAGEVKIRFPYHAHVVELVKAGIPAYARSYNAADRTWTVTAAYATHAVDLLVWFFPDARIARPGNRAGPAPQPSTARPFAVLHLLPSAPPELIEGAYKILARLHHPDVGGDPEAMRALNDGHDALKELATV